MNDGPKIVFLRPSSGPSIGGTKIIIYGRNFHEGIVRIRLIKGEDTLTTFEGVWANETEAHAIMPAYTDSSYIQGWGRIEVHVSIGGSRFMLLPEPYQYYIEPVVKRVFPFVVPDSAEQHVELLITASLSSEEISPEWWMEWKQIVSDAVITAHTCWYAPISNAASDEPEHIVEKDQILFTSVANCNVEKTMQDPDLTVAWLRFRVPENIYPGIYSIRLCLNRQQFGTYIETLAESNRFLVQLLYVHKTMIIRGLSPKAVSVKGGQVLKITGEHFRTFSLENKLIVRFSKVQEDGQISQHIEKATLECRNTILSCQTPQFSLNGWYSLDVSFTDGDHYVESSKKLLIFLQPKSPYLQPTHGCSSGGMLLSLRIIFTQQRLYQRDMSIPMEETEFDDAGCFLVRFIEITTGQKLATVDAFLSKDKEYIQCRTPRNAMVNAFQYSDLETVALQLSLDGIDFQDLEPQKPFSYYPLPRIASISASTGPDSGGTDLIITLEHRVPDTGICRVKFQQTQEPKGCTIVEGTVSGTMSIHCKTPLWIRTTPACIRTILEVSYNGVEFSNAGKQVEFCFFDQPSIKSLEPKAIDTSGQGLVAIYFTRPIEPNGLTQVAFSDGITTKIVTGNVIKGHMECKTPIFPVGPCQVNISMNQQQFTGKWNETGDCISKDRKTAFTFYDQPKLTFVSPRCGHVSGGTEIVIGGDNLIETGVISVRFTSPRTGCFKIVPGRVIDRLLRCQAPPFDEIGMFKIDCSLNSRDFAGDAAAIFHYYKEFKLKTVSPEFVTKGLPLRLEIRIDGMIESDSIALRLVFPFVNSIEEQVHRDNYIRSRNLHVDQDPHDVEVIRTHLPELACFPDAEILVPYLASIQIRQLFMEIALDGQNFTSIAGNLLANDVLQVGEAPVVTHVQPSCCPVAGETRITLYGSHFGDTGHIRIRFVDPENPKKSLVTFGVHEGENKVSCITPPWKFSPRGQNVRMEIALLTQQYVVIGSNVAVSTLNRSPDAVTPGFTFNYYSSPVLVGLSHQVGPCDGNTIVQIRGRGFHKIRHSCLRVRFGKKYTVDATCRNDKTIECITRCMNPGKHTVSLSFNGQHFFTREKNCTFFAYTNPRLGPKRMVGSTDGNSYLHLPGTGFLNSSTITVRFINTGLKYSFDVPGRFIRETEITCYSPSVPRAVKMQIQVALDGQNFITNPDCVFVYYEAPKFSQIVPRFFWSLGGNTSLTTLKLTLTSLECIPESATSTCIIELVDEESSDDYALQLIGKIHGTLIECPLPLIEYPCRLNIFISFDGGEEFNDSYGFVTIASFPKDGITEISPPFAAIGRETDIRISGIAPDVAFAEELNHDIIVRLTSLDLCYDFKARLDKDQIVCRLPPIEGTGVLSFSVQVALNGIDFIGGNDASFSLYPKPKLTGIQPYCIPDECIKPVRILSPQLSQLKSLENKLTFQVEFVTRDNRSSIVKAEWKEGGYVSCIPPLESNIKANVYLLIGKVRVDDVGLPFTFYKPPFYLHQQAVSSAGGASITIHFDSTLSSVPSHLKVILTHQTKDEAPYLIPAKFPKGTFRLSIVTPAIKTPGEYRCEIACMKKTKVSHMWSNGSVLKVFEAATIEECQPVSVPYTGSLCTKLYIIGTNFADPVDLRFRFRRETEEITIKMKGTLINSNKVWCRVPKLLDIEQVDFYRGTVDVSLNGGLEYSNTTARFCLYDAKIFQHLDVQPRHIACFPQNTVNFTIGFEEERSFAISDSYTLQVTHDRSKQVFRLPSTRISSSQIVCETDRLTTVGTYTLGISPNGYDVYGVGTVLSHDVVRLGTPSPKWICFDPKLGTCESILIVCGSNDILCHLDELFVKCVLNETEKPQLLKAIIKSDQLIEIPCPEFSKNGTIQLQLMAQNTILSTISHLMTYDNRNWKISHLSSHFIAVGCPGNLDLYGSGIENTGNVVVRLKNDSESIDTPGVILSRQELHICIEKAERLLVMDLYASDPVVHLNYEGKTVRTSIREKTVNPVWNESFTFIVDDPNTIIEGLVEDVDSKTKNDFLGRFRIDVKDFSDHDKQHSVKYNLVSDYAGESDQSRGSISISLHWSESTGNFIRSPLPPIPLPHLFNVFVSPGDGIFLDTKLQVQCTELPSDITIRPTILPWSSGGTIKLFGTNWAALTQLYIRCAGDQKQSSYQLLVASRCADGEYECIIPGGLCLPVESNKLHLSISMDKWYFKSFAQVRLFRIQTMKPFIGPLCGGTSIQVNCMGENLGDENAEIEFMWLKKETIVSRCCLRLNVVSSESNNTIYACKSPCLPTLPFGSNPTASIRIKIGQEDAVLSSERLRFQYEKMPCLKEPDSMDANLPGVSTLSIPSTCVQEGRAYFFRFKRGFPGTDPQQAIGRASSKYTLECVLPRLNVVGAVPLPINDSGCTLWLRHRAVFVAVVGCTHKPETHGQYNFAIRAVLEGKSWCRTKLGKVQVEEAKSNTQCIKWNELMYIPNATGSLDLVLEETLVHSTTQKNDSGLGHVLIDVEKELRGCEMLQGRRFVRKKFPLSPWRLKDAASHRSRLGEIEIALIAYGDLVPSRAARRVSQLKRASDLDCRNQQLCWIDVSLNETDFVEPENAIPCYLIEPPLLARIEPAFSTCDSGVEIDIRGENFPIIRDQPKPFVVFYTTSFDHDQSPILTHATSIVPAVIVSSTLMRCKLPRLPTPVKPVPYNVAVSFNGKDFDSFPIVEPSSVQFTTFPHPRVTDICQTGRYTTQLYIIGEGFLHTGNVSVCFALEEDTDERYIVTATVLSPTRIECTSPPLEIHTSVMLSLSLDGKTFDSEWPHALELHNTPTLASVRPSVASARRESKIRLYGTNYDETGEIQVRFSSANDNVERIVQGVFVAPGTIDCILPRLLGSDDGQSFTEADFPSKMLNMTVSLRLFADEPFLNTQVSIILYSDVPSITQIQPTIGLLNGGWRLHVYTEGILQCDTLSVKFVRKTSEPNDTVERTAFANWINAYELHVVMPRLEKGTDSLYFIQLSLDGIEFTTSHADAMIALHEKGSAIHRTGSMIAMSASYHLDTGQSRRSSDIYTPRLIADEASQDEGSVASSRHQRNSFVGRRRVSSIASFGSEDLYLSGVPCLWPTATGTGKLPSFVQHMEAIHKDSRQKKLFHYMLERAFTNFFDAPSTPSTPRSRRRSSTKLPAVERCSSRSSSMSLAMPPDAIESEKFCRLVKCQLYPLLTDADYTCLWRIVDSESKGYVTLSQVEESLGQIAKFPCDLSESLADPGRYNPRFDAVERKVQGYSMERSERFSQTEKPSIQLEYDYDDSLIHPRPPKWGIGHDFIAFDYNQPGRHWIRIQPRFEAKSNKVRQADPAPARPKEKDSPSRRRSSIRTVLERRLVVPKNLK